MDRIKLIKLAEFLSISADEKWLDHSLENYKIRKKYTHSDDLKDFFKKTLESMFTKFPDEKMELLNFVGEK